MIPKPKFLQPINDKVTAEKHGTDRNQIIENEPSTSAKNHSYFSKFGSSPKFNPKRHPHNPNNNRNKHHRFSSPRGGDRERTDDSGKNGNIKCQFKGCRFMGPPDVVKFHNEIQHMELRNKYNVNFSSLATPEDIEKWRAERRARYPTVENAQKKEAAISNENANESGGDRKQWRKNHKPRHSHRNNWNGPNNNTNKNNRFRNKRNHSHMNSNNNSCADNFNIKRSKLELEAFSGDRSSNNNANMISSVTLSNSNNHSNNNDEPIVPDSGTQVDRKNSLNLLSCYYSSDNESDDNRGEDNSITIADDHQRSTITSYKNDDHDLSQTCRNDCESKKDDQIQPSDPFINELMNDILRQVEDNVQSSLKQESTITADMPGNRQPKPPQPQRQNQQQQQQSKKRRRRPNLGPPITYQRLTLYQKLMLQDVRKVKDELMACLQVIVNNNFFETSSQDARSDTSIEHHHT